jgi:hypothetical protein
MTNKMKLAVKANITLIDDGQYDDFYKKISSSAANGYQDISDVTTFLIETCGVTPDVSWIPHGYMFKNTKLNTVKIPEGIIGIGLAAYLGSSVREVELPSSCAWISAQAFSGCNMLEEIRINNPEIKIDDSAFTQTPNIGWIMYTGTKEQFINRKWPEQLTENSYVICVNGTIRMYEGIVKNK